MAPLTGKCALVTGSTQGLGRAAAIALAASGCHLVLNGLAEASAVAELRQEIERDHRVSTIYDPADLRDPDQVASMMTGAARAFGAVDILVNNAVVRHVGGIETFDPGNWNEALAVNLTAAFLTIRAAVPAMKQRGWGRIVNVSSIYGLRGAPNRVGYVTTKTALLGLTRAVALETAGSGVTCNAVCPGTADTPVHEESVRRLMSEGSVSRVDAERQLLTGKQPSGRLIDSRGVAALIVFLCGYDAADINGAALPVDGAWSAG